ncbi:glycosyltransferase [bacterium]|nr:glycosyltransferase [bacterium]|tara:strand:- start:4914 stop:5627 length:714 start_codon:yes stop_codon:yes gene_type:complete
MIPKIIHQIWLGGGRLSAEQKYWQSTWKKHNPEWEFIVWDENALRVARLDGFLFKNSYIAEYATSLAEVSDLLRYEILFRYGGVYTDIDYECLKPIDDLMSGKSFVAGAESDEYMCNAFIASAKGGVEMHDLVESCYARHQHIKETQAQADIDDEGFVYPAQKKYGTVFFSDIAGYEKAVPRELLYPYLWDEMDRRNEDFAETCPEAYAVHHWASSWHQEEDYNDHCNKTPIGWKYE